MANKKAADYSHSMAKLYKRSSRNCVECVKPIWNSNCNIHLFLLNMIITFLMSRKVSMQTNKIFRDFNDRWLSLLNFGLSSRCFYWGPYHQLHFLSVLFFERLCNIFMKKMRC